METINSVYLTQDYADFFMKALILVVCEFEDGTMKGVVFDEPSIAQSKMDVPFFKESLNKKLAITTTTGKPINIDPKKFKKYLKRRDELLTIAVQ